MSTPIALVVLALMAAVTYLTRAGGVWAINRVTITPRVEAVLDATTGATLVALIAPAAVDGDVGARAALAVAAATMVVTRRPLLAVAAGVATAAVARLHV